MTNFTRLIVTILLIIASPAMSQQDKVWVQIEAHPNLSDTQQRLRKFSANLPDVNGFALGGGWYAIALGPYARQDADQVLQVYRNEGTIPADSYIAFSPAYRRQIWPIGANASTPAPEPSRPIIETAIEPVPETLPQTEPEVPQFKPADETLREARRSERGLTRQQKRDLQTAMKWAGHYDAPIDGLYGKGTRNSMAGWQSANGYEPTGVLTTLQRQELLDQYNAVLIEVGLETVTNADAGIEMKLPLKRVMFDKVDYPFAHYNGIDENHRIELISQKGGVDTLYGLFDILHTLTIIPRDGEESRNSRGFKIEGNVGDNISYTQVWRQGDDIKGFTLLWPKSDEQRRARMLDEMLASFKALEGALSPVTSAEDWQSIDLFAGLELRKPLRVRSGFFTDNAGSVVTTSEAIDGCGSLTLEDSIEAGAVWADPNTNIAVLKPKSDLAPQGTAEFQTGYPRLNSQIISSGYPYDGVIPSPVMSFGTLADIKGLNGEPELRRLALNTLPSESGGPVFDATGAVMGMLLPRRNDGKQLPKDVSFAVSAKLIQELLENAGLTSRTSTYSVSMANEDITKLANNITVRVNCWE